MRTNLAVKHPQEFTAEGAVASRITSEQELRRSVTACMLFEDGFYESGESIADRIKKLVPLCRPSFVAACAFEARTKMKLRHVPLLLVREMARHASHRGLVSGLLPDVIQRADEITEFCAIYWREKRQPLSKQVKLGLAKAFLKFDEYALAKYNRDGAVKLRDVLFLCHAKPETEAQAALWKRLVDGKLETPDTWEVALSGGADKAATFIQLMLDKKLGALAFIRNFRNMKESGVDIGMVREYAKEVDIGRVLPFRFVAAARVVPGWEGVCDDMLLRSCAGREKLPGKTVVIVDTSGSMGSGKVSSKSDMTRLDAAGALAAILRESCDDCRLYATAGDDGSRKHATVEVPDRRGMALVEKFTKAHAHGGFHSSIGGGGIFLKQCMDWVYAKEQDADRVIVLTDEQDCDVKANPKDVNAFGKRNYLLNVSVEKNGISYEKFTHINGWSESCVEYIRECEKIAQ